MTEPLQLLFSFHLVVSHAWDCDAGVTGILNLALWFWRQFQGIKRNSGDDQIGDDNGKHSDNGIDPKISSRLCREFEKCRVWPTLGFRADYSASSSLRTGGKTDVGIGFLASPTDLAVSAREPVVPHEKSTPELEASIVNVNAVSNLTDGTEGFPEYRMHVHTIFRRPGCEFCYVNSGCAMQNNSHQVWKPRRPHKDIEVKSVFLLLVTMGCAAASGAAEKTSLLPDTIGPPAQAVATALPELYDRHGLYEYLDGGADIYIESGMKTCTVRHYHGLKMKKSEFEIAVYDMGTPLCAFGLFRQLQERHAHGIGTESAGEPRRISFWKSSLYSEVVDKSLEPVPDSMLASLARALSRRLPGDTNFPMEIRLLPEPGKIAGSEQYRMSGFLSRSFLNNVISAQYTRPAGACTLFVMISPSDSAAAALLSLIGKAYNGDDTSAPKVSAFASRSRVAGCVGCTPKEFEKKWFGVLLEQLRKQ
jgi:hypothetical protein